MQDITYNSFVIISQGYTGLKWWVSGLWKKVLILTECEICRQFYKLSCVAHLSGQHTHSGPVFEQGRIKLYSNMWHYMVERAKKWWNLHMELRQLTCVSMGLAFAVVRPSVYTRGLVCSGLLCHIFSCWMKIYSFITILNWFLISL